MAVRDREQPGSASPAVGVDPSGGVGSAPARDRRIRSRRCGETRRSPSSPAIAAAFQTLHAEDRETFLLFALGELTYDEVAVALAIPTGTVRSRIFRVRKILREQLSDVAAIKGSDSESPSITEGQG